MATHQFDHLSLVVSDAEHSLEGLTRSIQVGSVDMQQGALYARDLSGALSVLGLDTAASLVEDVARQLTLGQPSVLDVAQGLLPNVASALKDIQLGQILEPDAQLKVFGPWASRLQVLVSRDTASLSSFEAVAPKSAQVQLLGQGDPGFKAMRMKGLSLIQNARIVNQRDDERTVVQMDALLSELQDWTLRVGQVPLSQLFPLSTQAMQEVWLDSSLLDLLDPLRELGAQAGSIQAQSRSLTIYMDWLGLNLSNEEFQKLGHCMAAVAGHVKRLADGYRLVFPCSLSRMRMTPYVQNGVRYAVGAGQFIQFDPHADGTGFAGLLTLCSGLANQSLQVERVLPAQNMNIFAVPPDIPKPEGVSGVALDAMGEIYYCLSMT
ncbi:MAG: hypothetical protein NTX67_09005 [Burkholderiales bacterium]|nr:hypothetical protein [Burkholderiales bacterium]